MPEKTHAEMMEFLPNALLRAIQDYNDLLEAESTLPPPKLDDHGNPQPPQDQDTTTRNKNFAAHQAALKSAIINIELIYKLLEKVTAKSGGNQTAQRIEDIIRKSKQEINDYRAAQPADDFEEDD